MRKSIAFLLIWTLCLGIAGIFAVHKNDAPHKVRVVAAVDSEDDSEVLGLIHGKLVKHAVMVRERKHQLHLAQLKASRSKERTVESVPSVPTGSVWDAVAGCESGGRWDYNGSSGYDGGLQFDPGTWADNKFSGYPDYAYQATREQQIAVAEKVLSESTWAQQWPACSLKLGLRKE